MECDFDAGVVAHAIKRETKHSRKTPTSPGFFRGAPFVLRPLWLYHQ
jgi:hypothetical protein